MRIKYSKLPMLRNLTNKEMDFFLYIARYQDLAGNVPGVHNQDVCKHTGMCKQSFYTVLRSLQKKGIIEYRKCSEIDYDIHIVDNDFSYDGAFQEGYINLHREVFHLERFKKLKANEKYLLFELLKRTHENRSSFRIGTQKFYENWMAELGVTKRVIRYYLHSLRKFFLIGIKQGKYYITYLHSVFNQKEEKTIDEQEFDYFVEVQCRREKIKFTSEALHDTGKLLRQYRPGIVRQGGTLGELKRIMAQCIQTSIQGQDQRTRHLNSKYIHKLMQTALFEEIEAF